ncbi:hypothetical protein VDG1235_3140 [Verrucomicrobiia bacterium DG1235]|nr:hypothetical protein VDG1235_3140 [Verrucomicrobiae bacterium DG1235]
MNCSRFIVRLVLFLCGLPLLTYSFAQEGKDSPSVDYLVKQIESGETFEVPEIGKAAYISLLDVFDSSLDASHDAIEQLVELQELLRSSEIAAERMLSLTINAFVDDYALFELMDFLHGDETLSKAELFDEVDWILTQNRIPESEVLADVLSLCCITFEGELGESLEVEGLLSGEIRILPNDENRVAYYSPMRDPYFQGINKGNATDYLLGQSLHYIQRGRTSRWIKELLVSEPALITLDPIQLYNKIASLLGKRNNPYIRTGNIEAIYTKDFLLEKKFYRGHYSKEQILEESGLNETLFEIDRRRQLTYRFLPFLNDKEIVWMPEIFEQGVLERKGFHAIPVVYIDSQTKETVRKESEQIDPEDTVGADLEETTESLGTESTEVWHWLVGFVLVLVAVLAYRTKKGRSD